MNAIGQGNNLSFKEWPKIQKEVQSEHCCLLNMKGGSPTKHNLAQINSA